MYLISSLNIPNYFTDKNKKLLILLTSHCFHYSPNFLRNIYYFEANFFPLILRHLKYAIALLNPTILSFLKNL